MYYVYTETPGILHHYSEQSLNHVTNEKLNCVQWDFIRKLWVNCITSEIFEYWSSLYVSGNYQNILNQSMPSLRKIL